jgi:hypothetical protein
VLHTVHVGDVGRGRHAEGDELRLVRAEAGLFEERREVIALPHLVRASSCSAWTSGVEEGVARASSRPRVVVGDDRRRRPFNDE